MRVSPPSQVVSKFYVLIAEDARAHGYRILLEDAEDTDINTEPLPSKRRRTQLTILSTTATLSSSVHPRPNSLRDRMANPRASETHHHQNRLQKQRRRKFGCSKLSWQMHGLTLQQLLHWRRSVSRPDSGLGRSVDRLRSRGYSSVFLCILLQMGGGGRHEY